MNREQIDKLLLKDHERFIAKGLFGHPGDSFSIRVPGESEYLLIQADTGVTETISLREPGDGTPNLHALLYQVRPDVGALLLGSTPWCVALAGLDVTIPILFDDQARYVGSIKSSVNHGDSAALIDAVSDGANIAIFGQQRLCLGVTPERIVFNAELFEKCAMAFVIAHSSGLPVHRVPWWVRLIAGSRLKRDQRRGAESLAAGHIPEGMNAY